MNADLTNNEGTNNIVISSVARSSIRVDTFKSVAMFS
jgi:hypothetical protein